MEPRTARPVHPARAAPASTPAPRPSGEAGRAERLQVRANKLDLLERVADDLAHEIKNPLHSMVINLEVLKRRIARAESEGTPEMLRYAEVLARELERLSHRIELLLGFVRPGRGAEPITLNDLVVELTELLEIEAAKSSVRLVFEPAPAGARAYLPREAARQIVLNLILDVLETLSPGDTLELRAEQDDGVRLVFAPHAAAESGVETAPNGGTAPPTALQQRARLLIAGVLAEEIGGRVDLASHDSAAPAPVFHLPTPR